MSWALRGANASPIAVFPDRPLGLQMSARSPAASAASAFAAPPEFSGDAVCVSSKFAPRKTKLR